MSGTTPASTYRIQVTADFDLFDTARTLSYLHDLGVDWVYLSPILEAEPGSTHGYDVVAHDRVDAARGGPEGLAAVSAEARRLGMGILVDIVPNHVGVATPRINAWWWDLLRHGRGSAYADCFDVDWAAGDGKLLIPVVGEGDEAAIEVRDDEVRYHDNRYPLAPGSSTLEEQHYRLVDWRRGDSELNYRRFFTVTTLAGIRVEDPDVFDASHVEIRRWFDEGLVDGLRVDHPDGLRDPAGYLDSLADLTGSAYVLVEKILERGESLESGWATSGTTGYDVLGLIDRVLTDPEGEAGLDALAGGLDWAAMIHGTKRVVTDHGLRAEVRRIVREFGPGDVSDRAGTEDAVAELLACFPAYRSYLPLGRDHLDAAFTEARRGRPDLVGAFDALLPVLSDPAQPAALRFQQTSGMVMAKGVEDGAFYRYPRLTSLNEVGGDPGLFAVTVADFHDAMATRQREWPQAMTTTTTHDTKRGEDVRARIGVLAEVPDLWVEALEQLLALVPLPDRAFANLLWQAVLGVWRSDPDAVLRGRLHAYAEKAMREAGDHTTWTAPDAAYEEAVHAAVDAAFDVPEVNDLLIRVCDDLDTAGRSNSLSAKLVALTMPGVPDVYQGSEVWEQSLVDPDNRRPVDFGSLAAMLRSDARRGPAFKQRLVRSVLTARRDRPELFTSYSPVLAQGEAAGHVLAFDRGGALTVVTRLPVGLDAQGGWGETTLDLPEEPCLDRLDGAVFSGRTRLADLLASAPVAFLERQ